MSNLVPLGGELAVSGDSMDVNAWGQSEFTAKDLIIPKIMMMQPTSSMVIDGKAVFGQFVNSLTGEVMGSFNEPLNIIPILLNKLFIVKRRVANKGTIDDFEFVRYENVTVHNENLPWDSLENGKEIQRRLIRNFYVLVEGHGDMPYMLSLKSTSSKSAQVLATQMYTLNALAKLPPCGTVMSFGATKEKNDNGSYVVAEFKPVKRTDKDICDKAFNWFQAIKNGVIKVDNKEEVEQEVKDLKKEELFNKDSKF